MTGIHEIQMKGRGEKLFDDEPKTLADVFHTARENFNQPNALNYKKDGRWHPISSSEMIETAEFIAAGLRSLGVSKGDRVAILAANSPQWTLVDAGCQFAGVIDVPIYTTLSPESVRYIIDDSESKILFIENRKEFDRISDALENAPSIERVVFFDSDSGPLEHSSSLDDLLRLGRDSFKPDDSKRIKDSIRPTDIATLIYTSGTTGEPKGVMLTHSNIVSNVIDAGERYALSADDVALSVLPLSHIFERSAMYLYLLNGMAVHYAESIEKVPENLAEVRPTILVGVPRIFEKVYARAKLKASQSGGVKEKIFDWAIDQASQHCLARETGQGLSGWPSIKYRIADRLVFTQLRQFFGGRLRFCITGGAALPNDIYLIFTGAGIPIMQGYGLTETSPVLTSNTPTASRLGSVGKPIRNAKIRIAEDGEIEAFGPGIMIGYYRKEQATSEAFSSDGWFRTGDIGKLDGDGFLFITDRKKELFKTSAGKYIAPSPIEQMIRSSRFVNQAVLVGNERKYAAALVVPNFDQLASYAKLKGLQLSSPREFCENPRIIDLIERQVAAATSSLARFETVKKIALLENELSVEGGELTPTLKIKRRVVEEKYKSQIASLYKEN